MVDDGVRRQKGDVREHSLFAFTMAFQPIVDIRNRAIWGYEALVRGSAGEPAAAVLEQVNDGNRCVFDQACRVKAIELAGELFPANSDLRLSINFMPNALVEPAACLRVSLEAARCVGFDPRRIMFEITESEHIKDVRHMRQVLNDCKRYGAITAIDDFGSGHSTLSLLARYQPDVLKLDMDLVRGISTSRARQAILTGVMVMARELGVEVVAEGVETEAELSFVQDAGVGLIQGFLFARPVIADLTAISPVGRDQVTKGKGNTCLGKVGSAILNRLG
jgi:EAL domain-containing protein (putative c-di-GMP-specific phosphodiesterase class I)